MLGCLKIQFVIILNLLSIAFPCSLPADKLLSQSLCLVYKCIFRLGSIKAGMLSLLYI